MPPKKKTIQDIKPTRKSLSVRKKRAVIKEKAVEKMMHEEPAVIEERVRKTPASRKKNSSKKGSGKTPKAFWLFLGFVVIVFLFLFSTIFAGATVTVTPENIILPDGTISLEAKKNITSGLAFQTITVSGDRQLFVESDNVEPVERRARGTVTLFNNHGSSPQRLLIDTRLEGSNGKIYKTEKAVTIPGKKTINGEAVPGSVSVGIYADEPGEEYNLGLSDFSIVGFQGGPKAKTFYGRGDTPIEGGVIGSLYTLSEEVSEMKRGEVSDLLQYDLQTKLEAQIPEGFILVEGSEEYVSSEASEYFESNTPRIEVAEEGSLTAVLLDASNLAMAIADKTITAYDGEDVSIGNIPALIIKNNDPAVGIAAATQISVSISGKPHIIWDVDNDRVKYDLVKTRKKQFDSIMSRYESIEEARLSVQPFWQGSLPEDIEDIKIVNTLVDSL
jgi:hypothetical protein